MDAYLRIIQTLAKNFEFFELTKVPHGENVCADALAALGSKLHDQVKRTIPIHRIERPSIETTPETGPFVAPVSETTQQSVDEPSDIEMPNRNEPLTDWRT